MKKQHDLYVNNLVGDIKANPRDFYRYINSQKKDTQGTPPLKRRNGSGLAESELEKTEEFNGQFMDVFNKSEHTQVPLPNRSAPFLKEIHVSAEVVTKLLKGLNPSKALGPDELHPRVLKELGPMFAHLFQQSIDTGEIPKEWSLANIGHLYHKKGARSLTCNYRPVSLTCVPCKLLEHIVCSNIMAHLDEYKLLSERPDELHPRVLKELGPMFAHLFQQSIDTGEIPKEWSLANIGHLYHKKGARSLTCNYRPVSLTCVPCKLLEHIVCSNIMAHLDEYKLLSERQHAFRKKHSCETQLITVIDDWAKILDKGGQVDTFILDFEKAFDTPSHELLKCKLYGYGIGDWWED